jgi:hypothetical protein
MHQSKSQALNSFIDLKFGMYIHGGAYSRPAAVSMLKDLSLVTKYL